MSGASPPRVASSWAALRNGCPYECRLGVQVQADPPWRGPLSRCPVGRAPSISLRAREGRSAVSGSLGRPPTSRLELYVYLDMQRHPYER